MADIYASTYRFAAALITSRHAICGSMAHHFLEEAARDDVQRLLAFARVLKSILPLWELVEVFCRLELLCILLLSVDNASVGTADKLCRSTSFGVTQVMGAWGVARRDWLRTDGKPHICSWPSLCTPANKAQLSLQCTQLTKLLAASHQPVRYQLSKNSTYTVNIQLTRNVNTHLIVQIYVES